ncbi:unnamed protein product [Cyprideis torosa]|uniref:Signal recognition particle 9 kDa protein n=1 Tax=Cyprideis torosa TaxID=163714 RepID=A0A7R8ZKT9_9CRUS|nr:unnamed protein product [Cyprideis torosa]CAG0880931.1 unnamed protein product [Cyprideis torosa]
MRQRKRVVLCVTRQGSTCFHVTPLRTREHAAVDYGSQRLTLRVPSMACRIALCVLFGLSLCVGQVLEHEKMKYRREYNEKDVWDDLKDTKTMPGIKDFVGDNGIDKLLAQYGELVSQLDSGGLEAIVNQFATSKSGGSAPIADMLKTLTTGPMAENLFGGLMKSFADNQVMTNMLQQKLGEFAGMALAADGTQGGGGGANLVQNLVGMFMQSQVAGAGDRKKASGGVGEGADVVQNLVGMFLESHLGGGGGQKNPRPGEGGDLLQNMMGLFLQSQLGNGGGGDLGDLVSNLLKGGAGEGRKKDIPPTDQRASQSDPMADLLGEGLNSLLGSVLQGANRGGQGDFLGGLLQNPQMLMSVMALMQGGGNQAAGGGRNPLLELASSFLNPQPGREDSLGPVLQMASQFLGGSGPDRGRNLLGSVLDLVETVVDEGFNEEQVDSLLEGVEHLLGGYDEDAGDHLNDREIEEEVKLMNEDEEYVPPTIPTVSREEAPPKVPTDVPSQERKKQQPLGLDLNNPLLSNLLGAFQGSSALKEIQKVAMGFLSGQGFQPQYAVPELSSAWNSVANIFSSDPLTVEKRSRVLAIAQRVYETYSRSGSKDFWEVVNKLNSNTRIFQPRIHKLLQSNGLSTVYGGLLSGVAAVLSETDDSKNVVSEIKFLVSLINEYENTVILKYLKPLLMALQGDKFMEGVRSQIGGLLDLVRKNKVDFKSVTEAINPWLLKSLKQNLGEGEFGVILVELVSKLSHKMKKVDVSKLAPLLSDPSKLNSTAAFSALRQAIPLEVMAEVIQEVTNTVDGEQVGRMAAQLIQNLQNGNLGQELGRLLSSINEVGGATKPTSSVKRKRWEADEFEKEEKKEGKVLQENAIPTPQQEKTMAADIEIPPALFNVSLRDAILGNSAVRHQFDIFMKDFIEKFLKRALKSENYREGVERLMSTDLLKHAEIPTLLLDMILRPNIYERPEKLNEAYLKFLSSNEIRELVEVIDGILRKSDLEDTQSLLSSLVETMVESKLLEEVFQLIDPSILPQKEDIKASLMRNLAEPILNLIGIYLHSVHQPGCAAQWLCTFSHSLPSRLEEGDGGTFWFSSAYRTGGESSLPVVFTVLTASLTLNLGSKMPYVESWDDFERAAEKLYELEPRKARFTMKYSHRNGMLTLKMTDNVRCVIYKTEHSQDLKRMEKYMATLMRTMASKEH